MKLYEKYIGEAASKYKKEFTKYAYEIIENYIKANVVSPITMKENARQLQAFVVRIMGAMALTPGSPEHGNLKKYFPKKYNQFLFDNGEGNAYESEWLSMTDAKQFTIARDAMMQYSKAKMDNILDRKDLIK
jgi:hypothetical protein